MPWVERDPAKQQHSAVACPCWRTLGLWGCLRPRFSSPGPQLTKAGIQQEHKSFVSGLLLEALRCLHAIRAIIAMRAPAQLYLHTCVQVLPRSVCCHGHLYIPAPGKALCPPSPYQELRPGCEQESAQGADGLPLYPRLAQTSSKISALLWLDTMFLTSLSFDPKHLHTPPARPSARPPVPTAPSCAAAEARLCAGVCTGG